MKRILYTLILLITFLPIENVKAACSGADCCTITSGVVTFPDNDSCSIQPSTYGITLYDKYLCTAAITAPTTSSNADLSNCVRTFQSTTGSVVRIKVHLIRLHFLTAHLQDLRQVFIHTV